MTAKERGDSRPVARLAAYGRGVVLKSPGGNTRRTERTHAGEEEDTDAKRRGIQGDGSLSSIPRSLGATAVLDEDSPTMSDEDNRTPSQRGGSEEKTSDRMPEFNQLSQCARRRYGDGLGCGHSPCRARNADLLFEMCTLRCEISSLNRRFAAMEMAMTDPSQTGRGARRQRRAAIALDRGAEGETPPSDSATAGSTPASSAMQVRLCFSCRLPGHMWRQCPHRNQITGLKAYTPPGGASSAR